MTRSLDLDVAATPNHTSRPALRKALYERQSCLVPAMGSNSTENTTVGLYWPRSLHCH